MFLADSTTEICSVPIGSILCQVNYMLFRKLSAKGKPPVIERYMEGPKRHSHKVHIHKSVCIRELQQRYSSPGSNARRIAAYCYLQIRINRLPKYSSE